MKWIEILRFMAVTLLVLGFGLTMWFEISNELDVMFDECYEEEFVKYRYEGTGGLFGGVTKVYLDNDSINFDGREKICVKGLNIFGDYIEK